MLVCGFLAKITEKLAGAKISVNAVSAYYHDHLFVSKEKAGLAMKKLKELQKDKKTEMKLVERKIINEQKEMKRRGLNYIPIEKALAKYR